MAEEEEEEDREEGSNGPFFCVCFGPLQIRFGSVRFEPNRLTANGSVRLKPNCFRLLKSAEESEEAEERRRRRR